jgi:hypothetical protein
MKALTFIMIGMVIGSIGSLYATAKSAQMFRSDSLVQTFERRVGVTPGTTRVVPECSCTVRYDGTEIIGSHYRVFFDRLD